jgi:hypothetical protein
MRRSLLMGGQKRMSLSLYTLVKKEWAYTFPERRCNPMSSSTRIRGVGSETEIPDSIRRLIENASVRGKKAGEAQRDFCRECEV